MEHYQANTKLHIVSPQRWTKKVFITSQQGGSIVSNLILILVAVSCGYDTFCGKGL